MADSIAFINNPASAVRGGADRIAADLRELRRAFGRAVATEVSKAMAASGTTRIIEGPVSIGGKQCLAVLCDHQSALTIEAGKPRIVLALREAARCRQWAPFESVDVSILWPHIFVCHAVQGRAVMSAGAFISTSVLIDAADFEVAGHHIADLPVRAEELANQLGLQTWDLPMLSAALALHGHLAKFMFAMMQGAMIVAEVRRHELGGVSAAAVLRATSHALNEARQRAIMAYQDVTGLLESNRSESQEGPSLRVQQELNSLLERLAFGTLSGARTLRLEDFEEWLEIAASGSGEVNAAIARLVDIALSMYSKTDGASAGT